MSLGAAGPRLPAQPVGIFGKNMSVKRRFAKASSGNCHFRLPAQVAVDDSEGGSHALLDEKSRRSWEAR
jgi:hypothetical protein